MFLGYIIWKSPVYLIDIYEDLMTSLGTLNVLKHIKCSKSNNLW